MIQALYDLALVPGSYARRYGSHNTIKVNVCINCGEYINTDMVWLKTKDATVRKINSKK